MQHISAVQIQQKKRYIKMCETYLELTIKTPEEQQ